MKIEKSINNVNTTNFDMALKMVGITLSYNTIDMIIDLVEIIEEKGDELSIKDVLELQGAWKKSNGLTLQ